jgi:hypothetical protein
MATSHKGADHVAELVDRLLAAEKRIQGRPSWTEGNPGDMRIRWPILVGTSVAESAFLYLAAFPNSADLRFTIGLNYRVMISRLDFVPEHEIHTNPLDRVWALEGVWRVHGPHYHSWSDNRHLCTASALPQDLTCARPLSPQIRRWEQAFRWFCGEVGIVLESEEIPDLPVRDRLL